MARTIRYKWTLDATTMTASVLDKTTGKSATFEYNALPAEIQAHCALQGLSRLLNDRTSQSDAEDKFAEWQSRYEDFRNGIYKRERKPASRTIPLVIEAIMQKKKLSAKQATDAYNSYTKAEQEVIKKNLAPVMEKIEADRKAAAEPNKLDDLLGA